MRKRISKYQVVIALVGMCVVHVGNTQTAHHASLTHLSSGSLVQFQKMIDSNQRLWDEKTKLLHAPGYIAGMRYPGNPQDDHHYYEKCCSKVRETAQYALALLYRDAPGDRQRAAEALYAVLKEQYVTSGVRWYGTFKRTPEEPDPGPDAAIWRDYDPNWREFIGTTFQTILVEYPDRIPADLSQRLYKSIEIAVAGEKADGRLVPDYTNPALMYGILWDFAAVHSKRPDWRIQSGDWIESVYCLFKKYGTFSEFNSPTYNVVDLYALAMWREYGSTEHIRMLGSAMEAALWQDIGTLFQPELHSLSGPYDRSYGMENTGDGLAALMRFARDPQGEPLNIEESQIPPGFSCLMAILGTRIPADVVAKLTSFQGEHMVRKQITDQRIATAWIGKNMIFGGEATSRTRNVGHNSQFHPVTIQWRTPLGELGWVRVVESSAIDATADKKGITISTEGTIRFRIHVKDLDPAQLTQSLWNLPGMRIVVTSDAQNPFALAPTNPAMLDPAMKGDDGMDIVYAGITKIRLDIQGDLHR
jgi:hypothetical protein